MPDTSDTAAMGVERWTIWVCDGCGAYGGVNELDRFGSGLVYHGESRDHWLCSRPARQVEVVPEARAADALAEAIRSALKYGIDDAIAGPAWDPDTFPTLHAARDDLRFALAAYREATPASTGKESDR